MWISIWTWKCVYISTHPSCRLRGIQPCNQCLWMSLPLGYKQEELPPIQALRWRHKERDSVSNHQPHHCLLKKKRLFRRRSKKISKLRVTGLCVGNSPGPVNSPHNRPVTRKQFLFDDVIMGCELLNLFSCLWASPWWVYIIYIHHIWQVTGEYKWFNVTTCTKNKNTFLHSLFGFPWFS